MKKLIYIDNTEVAKNIHGYHPDGSAHINNLEEYQGFTDDEITIMELKASRIETYFNDVKRLSPVTTAIDRFYKSIESAYKESDIETIEHEIENYISKFDMFKNHWETYIKRFIDNERRKVFTDIFTKETHNAFDNCEGFALMCCIRDRMTHAYNVIDKAHIGLDGKGLFCERDRLLNDWDWNKTKKELISKQPEYIDLIQAVTDSYNALCEISDALIIERTMEVYDDCKYLCEKRKELGIDKPWWFIVNWSEAMNSQGKTSLSYIQLNWTAYQSVVNHVEKTNITDEEV